MKADSYQGEITLVYSLSCPNAKYVRTALLLAKIYEFKVVTQDQLSDDDFRKKLSSPSVLNGEEVIFTNFTNEMESTKAINSYFGPGTEFSDTTTEVKLGYWRRPLVP
jgi:hypothetical protein